MNVNPLTVMQGRLTKLGAAVAAAGPLIQNVVWALRGEPMLDLVAAAQGPVGSVLVVIGAILTTLGGGRAAIGYGGGK